METVRVEIPSGTLPAGARLRVDFAANTAPVEGVPEHFPALGFGAGAAAFEPHLEGRVRVVDAAGRSVGSARAACGVWRVPDDLSEAPGAPSRLACAFDARGLAWAAGLLLRERARRLDFAVAGPEARASYARCLARVVADLADLRPAAHETVADASRDATHEVVLRWCGTHVTLAEDVCARRAAADGQPKRLATDRDKGLAAMHVPPADLRVPQEVAAWRTARARAPAAWTAARGGASFAAAATRAAAMHVAVWRAVGGVDDVDDVPPGPAFAAVAAPELAGRGALHVTPHTRDAKVWYVAGASGAPGGWMDDEAAAFACASLEVLALGLGEDPPRGVRAMERAAGVHAGLCAPRLLRATLAALVTGRLSESSPPSAAAAARARFAAGEFVLARGEPLGMPAEIGGLLTGGLRAALEDDEEVGSSLAAARPGIVADLARAAAEPALSDRVRAAHAALAAAAVRACARSPS